jgi:hypothetical protein
MIYYKHIECRGFICICEPIGSEIPTLVEAEFEPANFFPLSIYIFFFYLI